MALAMVVVGQSARGGRMGHVGGVERMESAEEMGAEGKGIGEEGVREEVEGGFYTAGGLVSPTYGTKKFIDYS